MSARASRSGPKGARKGRVYDRILEAYAEIESGAAADRTLKEVFARARDLGAKERARVGDVIYGLARRRRMLDDRLSRAAGREKRRLELLEPPMRQRLRVLALLALEGARFEDLTETDAYAVRRIPGLFERLVGPKLPEPQRSERERLGVEVSFPGWMIDRLADALGLPRTEAILRALNERGPATLRANRLLASRDEVLEHVRALEPSAEPTELSPDGIIVPQRTDVRAWELYREGLVEIQDEGSQLIAIATGAKPGEQILDACAGAGGKSLAVAAMMRGLGRIVSVDPDARKLARLKERARRAKVEIVETLASDLADLPDHLRARFDCVLVDAPCSGTGTLRRSPDLRWRATEAELLQYVHQQRALIASAVCALEPGGRLVYATCSVMPEENELMSSYIARELPTLRALPLARAWGDALSRRLGATHEARIGPGPSERGPDGFFVAAFERV